MVLDERDRWVLELLAEHRALAEPHVARRLDVAPALAARRLRALAAGGFVAHERIFAGYPASVTITRRGLHTIESALPVPRLDLKGYRHDLGVGWVWLAAGEGVFGALDARWSERAMRSHDRRAGHEGPALGARLGIGLGRLGPRGGERLHYPDLLLELASGHRVAVELELSAKGRRRLDEIMFAYAADGRIDVVLYLVPPGPLGARVEEAARRAGIADAVHVQLLAPGGIAGAPDPAGRAAPTRGRRPGRAPSRDADRAPAREASRAPSRDADRAPSREAAR